METLCWECAKSCGECSWAREFKPVEGWEAKPTTIKGEGYKYRSYRVISCPQFQPDKKRIITYAEIAKLLEKSERTLFRWSINDIQAAAKAKGYNLKYNWADKIWYEIRGEKC